MPVRGTTADHTRRRLVLLAEHESDAIIAINRVREVPFMAQLIVRNLDEALVRELKVRAAGTAARRRRNTGRSFAECSGRVRASR